MQIVTDRGMDLAPEQLKDMDIHFAPLRIILDDKTYVSGIDIDQAKFYRLLTETQSFPTTSQPSAGEFASIYRELAKTDPEILSIHISSGLSGTIQAARAGAAMTPEANVHIYDSKTLSGPMGWQVQAAAKTIQAGWKLPEILALLDRISDDAYGLFTLSRLDYLIHGGRISHIKGLMASLLNIKPIIGVEKVKGMYESYGQEITFKRALNKMAEKVTSWYGAGSRLRIQPLHGQNLEGIELLKKRLDELFDVVWEPTTMIAPVLGAHTGPGMVGLAFCPVKTFEGLF